MLLSCGWHSNETSRKAHLARLRNFQYKELFVRTSLKPIQIQYVLVCVPEPSWHFSRLERRIPGTEVAIEHVGDFFGRAWLSDLVQGAPYVFVEGIRIWNLAHFWLSGGWKPICYAHSCVGVLVVLRTAVTRNWPVRAGESVCELPQVHVLRQSPLKYTPAQSRSVPGLAVPNSRSRAIRQSTLATPLVCRSTHVLCWPWFPSTAEHRRDSPVQSLLPSQCNFIERRLTIRWCKGVKATRDGFAPESWTTLPPIHVENRERRNEQNRRWRR